MSVTRRKSILHKVLSITLTLAMLFGNMISGNLQYTQAEETVEHHYNEKGFCTEDGCTMPYEKPEGDGTADSPYEIGNAGELYYFAGIVNDDEKVCKDGVVQNRAAHAMLTADIIVNEDDGTFKGSGYTEWTPIAGTSLYTGTFDGCNHTISGIYINSTSSYIGLFANSNGTVKNVGIIKSYICGEKYVGSIVGVNGGTIENCYSTATLVSTSASGNFLGGLAGMSNSGTVKNSYFAGTCNLKESKTVFNGIIGGEYDSASDTYTKVGTCENCYFVSGCGATALGTGVETRTSEQFANGQVAYELNGDQTTIVYGQTLSGENVETDKVQTMPVLGGSRVCMKATTVCPGSDTKSNISYFNGTADNITYLNPKHIGDEDAKNPYKCTECGTIMEHTCQYENGFCKFCDGYEKPEGNGTTDSPYEIGNAGELYYFAGIVNGESQVCKDGVVQNTAAYAKLTADIKINEGTVNKRDASLRQWEPIGTMSREYYEGTLDGCGHTISGLYCDKGTSNSEAALFMRFQGTLRNVGLTNSYLAGNSYVTSFVVYDYGTIENCYSTATLECVEDQCVAGIAAQILHSDSKVENCYFAGQFIGGDNKYGFRGIGAALAMQNGTYNSVGTIRNCYYLSGTGITDRDGAYGVTKDQMASGSVAYALNGDQTTIIYGQTLSGPGVEADKVQTVPVLGGQHVYEVLEKYCPGVKDTEPSVNHTGNFVNDESQRYIYSYPNHNYDSDDDDQDDKYRCRQCDNIKEHEHVFENDMCTLCGSFQEPEGNGTKEEPYRIGNASQLRWFALKAEKEESAFTDANVVLTDDIYLNPEGVTAGSVDAYYWSMIDTYPADAVFDGQGHSIHGLCYKGNISYGFVKTNKGTITDVVITGVSVELSSDAASAGSEIKTYATVCHYNYGTIENVSVGGQITSTGAHSVAGICYQNGSGGTIQDCNNACDMTAADAISGMVYRNYGTIDGCCNYGKIVHTGAEDFIGGIVSRHSGIVKNSINYGTIEAARADYVAGVVAGAEYADISLCANEGAVTGGSGVAGICGFAYEEVEIGNCYNTADITAGSQNAGGICAVLDEGTISSCFSSGKVLAGTTCTHQYAGGIAGNVGYDYEIEQCYYDKNGVGTGVGFYCENCSNYENNAGKRENSDGITALGAEAFTNGKIVWLMNKEAGETWLYQTDDGKVIFSLDGKEGYVPVRKAVYGCSGAKTPISEEFVRGEEDVITYVYKVHNYDADTLTCTECGKVLPHLCIYGEDGYCQICHCMQLPDGDGTKDSPYEISNAAELYWFAGVVNGDEDVCNDGMKKNVKACAVLTDDIVLNEEKLSAETTGAAVWTPIGIVLGDDIDTEMTTDAYKGCFDGQGHTVDGVYITDAAGVSTGFFSAAGSGSEIKNLRLENVYILGESYASGICNFTDGTIANCSVSGTIAATYTAGGITSSLGSSGTIYGCHNMAHVTANYAGGIVGYIYKGNVIGCYHTGKVSAADATRFEITQANGIIGDLIYSTGTVAGCYYLAENETAEDTTWGIPATEATFASGKVAYRMNLALKACRYDAGYGQILTGDNTQSLPVWHEKTTVYAVGAASCPGVEVSEEEGYSNDSSEVRYTYPDHCYEGESLRCTFCGAIKAHTCEYVDGYCKYCSDRRKPEGNGTKESPYQIGTAGELLWFRDKVSGDLKGETANPAAWAVLTQNIDVQSCGETTGETIIYWTPVGTSETSGRTRAYTGTFDGQNHIISGVAVETDERYGQRLGVFGQIGKEGVVQNLHIADSMQCLDYREYVTDTLSEEERYVGAFCNINQGVISGCSIDVELQTSNANVWYYAAGFAGENSGNIVNSKVSGLVNGFDYSGWDYTAGFCGVNHGTLRGCVNEATVFGYYDTAGICYYNYGTIEECHSADTVAGNIIYAYYQGAAGICSVNEGTIENCWNELRIENVGSGSYGSGICTTNYGRIAYCYNIGKVNYGIAYKNEKGAKMQNSYMLSSSDYICGSNNGITDDVGIYSADEFASGMVTYLLNQAQGKQVFGQLLPCEGIPAVSEEEADAYPVLGGKAVYPVGQKACPGCSENDELYTEIEGYSNTEQALEPLYPEHYYYTDLTKSKESDYCYFCKCAKEHTCSYENGICTKCGWFEIPEGDGTKEHPYKISNAGELCYFARAVEGLGVNGQTVTGNAAACAVLTNDINLANVPSVSDGAVITVSGNALEWTAIGIENATEYNGTFDGNGYTIQGLQSTQNVLAALFIKTGNKAVVKNLTLTDTYLRAGYAGGISLANDGRIENCSVSGRIEGYAIPLNMSPSTYEEYLKLQKLQNVISKLLVGSIEATSEPAYMAGGISTWNNGTIENCLVHGAVAGVGKAGFITVSNKNGNITNCYYCNTANTQDEQNYEENDQIIGKGIGTRDVDGKTQKVSSEELHSGKIAWMLDTGNSYGGNHGIWKQDRNTRMPVIGGKDADTVYYLSVRRLDGTTEEYYVPAGADISEYVRPSSGSRWVMHGGTETAADGSVLTDVMMNQQVLSIREEVITVAKLLSVTAPSNIAGVANGTAKTADALGLPETVAITTEDENITSAEVTWDLEHLVKGSYDSSATTKQTFTVRGTVVLPKGVDANGVSLMVEVEITVDAKGNVPVVDPSTPPQASPLPSADPGASSLPSANPQESPAPSGNPVSSESPQESPIPSGNPVSSESPQESSLPSDSPDVSSSDDPDVSPSPSATITKGDVDGNGTINLLDAQKTLKAALKLIKLDDNEKLAADVDGNGTVNLLDAQKILKYALKLIKSFD